MKRNQFVHVALAAALAFPAAGRAQDPRALRDQPVPRELVEALLAGSSGRVSPSIVVGELPPQLAGKMYVPPGGRVLGGTYTNSSSVAIILTSAAVDSVIAQYKRELPKLGWTVFDRFGGAGGAPSYGFRDAPSSAGAPSTPQIPLMFCSGGTTMVLQVDPVGISDARISASVSATNICSMLQQQMAQVSGVAIARVQMGASMDPFRSARWPVLINPPNAHATFNTCPSANSSSSGTGTDLSTTLTPEELFTHYAHQLSDSGWKASQNVTVGRTWTRTDSVGNQFDFEVEIKSFDGFPRCRKLSILTTMRSAR